MPSPSSALLRLAASTLGNRLGYHDLEETRRKVEKQQSRPRSYEPPRHLRRSCAVTVDTGRGWPVYEIRPRGRRPEADVVYLHGGAYIEEIGSNHWRMVKQLALNVPARVTVPVYPLAPRGQADQVVPPLTELATAVIEQPSGPVTLMGDSAGGGLAVATAQRLRDAGKRLPDQLVLLSPWLDVTMTDPVVTEVQPRDPMLASEPLRYAGELWAGCSDPADPLVSPVNGGMHGLPPMTVFAGTHEILLADALRLGELAEAASVPVRLVESPGQIHAYPLWPTREARQARREIYACTHGDHTRAA